MTTIKSKEEYNNKVIEAKKLIKKINSTYQELINNDLTLMEIIIKQENLDNIYNYLKKLTIEIGRSRYYIDFEEAEPKGS